MSRYGDVRIKLPTLAQVLPPAVREQLLRAAAEQGAGIIKRRTAQGVDVHGAPFAPYSPKYAAERERSGYSGTPNLSLTGSMLNGIEILTASPNEVILGPQGTGDALRWQKRARAAKGKKSGQKLTRVAAPTGKRVSNALKVLGLNQKRKFFALSSDEKRRISQHVQSLVRGS